MSEETNKKEESNACKIANIAAYPLAAWSGGYAYLTDLDDKLFGSLRKENELPEFDRYWDEFRKTKNISSEHHLSATEQAEFQKGWAAKYKEILNDRGYKNFMVKAKALHPNQQMEAAIAGMTVLGITLGVVLTAANSKNIIDELFPKKENSR